jgi:predicted transposase YbfD/YdcC
MKLSDSRDIRGKRHELAFIVVLFLTSILRSDKLLNLSVIHRAMLDDFEKLAHILGIKVAKCISYSQLKRLLQLIDYEQFNTMNELYFSFIIKKDAEKWFSVDGKELCGTIDGVSGAKRGLSIVNLTRHQSRQSIIIGHYDGSKASEKPVVRDYFEETDIRGQKFTFDALHTSKENLATIANKNGVYLAQLKANQKEMLEECELVNKHFIANFKNTDYQKGHGRVETRVYKGYNFVAAEFDERWKETKNVSLIVVSRERFTSKIKKSTQENSYWLSNQSLDNKSFNEISEAIRNHWSIETHHHIRDVQMGEDQIKISHKNEALVVASFITLTCNLLEKQEGNKSSLREKLSKNWKLIPAIFK